MSSQRRNVALAIKSCLESLGQDAARCELEELAHFIGLAALAAEEAAAAADPRTALLQALMQSEAGHC